MLQILKKFRKPCNPSTYRNLQVMWDSDKNGVRTKVKELFESSNKINKLTNNQSSYSFEHSISEEVNYELRNFISEPEPNLVATSAESKTNDKTIFNIKTNVPVIKNVESISLNLVEWNKGL